MDHSKDKTIETLPVPIEKPQVIAPLVSPEEAIEMLKQYQQLKAKIVEPGDIQTIKGKDFLKKSYWRRLAKFFGISLSLDKEWREKNEDNTLTFYAVITATAPNGQSCVGDGACNTGEKGLEKTDHNARAIAITRAKNRAISDLVGGGEVSAEEVNENDSPTPSSTPKDIITESQYGDMMTLMIDSNVKPQDVFLEFKKRHSIPSLQRIPQKHLKEVLEWIEENAKPKEEKKK
ncbi:MAG: hypothetical protein AMJ73_10085 [candidate division Zixibacteria bacterium SM1_73]|nr:MAG: hypothetical protein AMJ73_10085 [candidate division Zixibacteria bacterium SM1_73]